MHARMLGQQSVQEASIRNELQHPCCVLHTRACGLPACSLPAIPTHCVLQCQTTCCPCCHAWLFVSTVPLTCKVTRSTRQCMQLVRSFRAAPHARVWRWHALSGTCCTLARLYAILSLFLLGCMSVCMGACPRFPGRKRYSCSRLHDFD
jgi:hypothetical protein